jgi:hypothetical protein
VDGEIQGVDLINKRRDVADYFHLDRGCTLGFAEFSAQIFSGGFAKCAKIFVPVVVME